MLCRRFLIGAVVALTTACAAPQTPAPSPAPQTSADEAPPIILPPKTAGDIGIFVPPGANEWFTGHFTERVLLFHRTYRHPMTGGVAFVGDSITEGGNDWSALLPGVETRNYGIGGDSTVGLNNRFVQIVAARPPKVFLLIGTNDLNSGVPPAQIVANVGGLLDRFARELPNTRVYVQSVLPREARNAAGVLEINRGLQAVAAARGLTYVDIYTPFVDEGGRLDPSVTEDELHLNAAGYARWATVIDPLVRAP